MLLNGSTITSLEIYRNQTDFSEKGSLLWVLDHTRTKFGRRLLRKWIGRPLLARQYPRFHTSLTNSEVDARLAAVEEIKESTNYKLEDIASLLTRLPDLEKGLVRIHYGRVLSYYSCLTQCSRPELLSILQALSKVASKFQPFESPESVGFRSATINEAIYSLPTIATDVTTFLSTFNHAEAAKDNKFDMFKDNDPKFDAIEEHKMAIVAVEADLDEQLREIRKMLKNSKLSYVTVAGIEVITLISKLMTVFD
jgi:DNA mismatch repair protein MSH3